MKCDRCGGDVVDGKCTYCGKVFYDPDDPAGTGTNPSVNNRQNSKASNRKGMMFVIGVTVVVCFYAIFSASTDSDIETTSSASIEDTMSLWADEPTDINDFDYDIVGKGIHIKKYKGKDKKIRIAPSYEIDGNVYSVVELDGTFVTKYIDSVIVPEGVTEIADNTFNSCGVKYVYLPSTLKKISNNFLRYFHDVEKLYYGGSEQNWYSLVSIPSDKIDAKEIIFNADPNPEATSEMIQESLQDKFELDPIKNFSYVLSGDEIIINSYKGDNSIVEVMPAYIIEGVEYKTNLTEFKATSDVKTWIFDEGITDINKNAFNNISVEKIFFPSSMNVVYDTLLANISLDDGIKVEIYYGDSEDKWDSILTVYEPGSLADAEGPEELGRTLAEKLNKVIDPKYNKDNFRYHFNSSPDELK